MSETPLDQIRSAELAAARRIEQAREEADRVVAEARSEATRILDQAKKEGLAEADARFERAVADARRRAAEIELEPDRAIDGLRSEVEPRLGELADAMLELVLAPPEEKGV